VILSPFLWVAEEAWLSCLRSLAHQDVEQHRIMVDVVRVEGGDPEPHPAEFRLQHRVDLRAVLPKQCFVANAARAMFTSTRDAAVPHGCGPLVE
jgi:hypothetical protein